MRQPDLIIIGSGIVGTATAWKIKQRFPQLDILLIDKESGPACHQTGHNSGVIHAGVYYQPGSLKADFCRRGLASTYEFCRQYSIDVEQCGKLLVATDEREYERMAALEERCRQNRIETLRLDAAQLKKREPLITGVGALFVPATGITDYRAITVKMSQLFQQAGGKILFGAEVQAVQELPAAVRISLGDSSLEAGYLLACGGLMADRLARMTGIDINFRIIPFRGEYYRLSSSYQDQIKHLIYPIPDPDLPFLGVHLTRMIDGSITVGPNAVLGFKREGYGSLNVSIRDCQETFLFPGFWRMFLRHLGPGLSELRDSWLKTGYLKRVRKYCPQVRREELTHYPAGIRAQAVLHDGSLVHDFLFASSQRSLHVCNAPSPAATSAIPIAEYLGTLAAESFHL